LKTSLTVINTVTVILIILALVNTYTLICYGYSNQHITNLILFILVFRLYKDEEVRKDE